MTFAVLRALHAIIGDALDDIHRVYDPEPFSGMRASSISSPEEDGKKSPYASPPPTPSTSTHSSPLDFPSLDAPYDSTDPAEQLTAHPTVVVAINRILAAAGQMAAIVQTPFLSLCDASMGVRYSCLAYDNLCIVNFLYPPVPFAVLHAITRGIAHHRNTPGSRFSGSSR
jgi:hypothetical protein